MKIGVIGDTHYGASLTLGKKEPGAEMNTRLIDYNDTLIYTIDSMIDEGCSQIVFTGDIFEHRTPTIKQQELFSAALYHAVENGIEAIHIVVGNHDQQRSSKATTLSYIKELPLPKIHVYDEMDLFTVYDESGEPKANLIFMPYRDKRWLGISDNKEAIEHIDQQLAYHVSSITNKAPKIVVGHMTIEGTMWMLDEYSDLYSGNDLILPQDMFKSINITIMGHVHTPSIISKNPMIAYVGSMEKRSASENHDKKYTIIDLDQKKLLDFTEPCRNIFDLPIDFTNEAKGDNLMKHIYHAVDKYAEDVDMKSSIVRVLLSLSAGDDRFCNVKKVEAYIRNTYEAYHCVEIKPVLVFSRQSRDENITEHTSDSESFKRYIENEFNSHIFKAEMLEAGLLLIEGE